MLLISLNQYLQIPPKGKIFSLFLTQSNEILSDRHVFCASVVVMLRSFISFESVVCSFSFSFEIFYFRSMVLIICWMQFCLNNTWLAYKTSFPFQNSNWWIVSRIFWSFILLQLDTYQRSFSFSFTNSDFLSTVLIIR